MTDTVSYPTQEPEWSSSHSVDRDTQSIQGGGRGRVDDDDSIKIISFFERLRQIENADDLVNPMIATVFPAEEFSAFCLYHSFGLDQVQALFRGQRYSNIIKDGHLQRLWAWLRDFDCSGDPQTTDFDFPVAELHGPNVPGAETVYTISQSREKQVSLSVSIAGLGAGGSVTRTLKTEYEVPVPPGDCRVLVCDGQALLTRWVHRFSPKELILIDVENISGTASAVPMQEYQVVPEQEHLCIQEDSYTMYENQAAHAGLKLGKHFDRIFQRAAMKISKTIEKSYKYNAKWKIPDILGIGIDIGVEINSHYVESAKGSFNLPVGYRYIAAYKGERLQPLIWLAKKAEGPNFILHRAVSER